MIIVGYVNEDDVLEARRILVSPIPLFPVRRTVVIGTVESVSSSTLELTLRNAREGVKVVLSRKTQFQDAEGEKVVRSDIKPQQEVIAIIPDIGATPSASLVKIIK